ncbi:MAG: G8 domain-containing protein, partial [Pseudomonadota bacterium]
MNEMHDMNGPAMLWSSVKDQLVDADGNVVIPHGMTVILDEDTAPLGTLAIHGTLKPSDMADVTLTADNVLVFGALEAGTEAMPHTREFEIVLTGEAGDPDVVLADWAGDHGGMAMDHVGMGHDHMSHMTDPIDNKALIVAPGGRLDLHGADTTSWTQLDGTVEAGATSIEVLDASGWMVGDVITIAPTGMDAFEVEDRIITGIDGGTISFDTPLDYDHYGAQQVLSDGEVLDMRAEVANLSRNIVIRGEEDPNEKELKTESEHVEAVARAAYGGHVMVLNDTEVRIDGAEFTELGISGEAGRYPVHFHHSGDMEGSYVRDASIHHTFQRGIVVHQTDNLLVQDNVVYDVMSHGIYIEDGVETGNRFDGNLVMLPISTHNDFRLEEIRIHQRVREIGEKASGFWITNEENEFEGNHVVGVPTGQGFWFVAPDIDTSHVLRSDPRKNDLKLLQFEDNTAHTIMTDSGIAGNLGYGPIWSGVGLDIVEPFGEGSAPIDGFTAWMIGNMGVTLPEKGGTVINDLLVADARQAMRPGKDDVTIDGFTYVVTSDNFPEGADPAEFFSVGAFEGPLLGSFEVPSTVMGLQILEGDALVSAMSEAKYLENLTLLPDADGLGLTSLADLAQKFVTTSRDDDGSGQTILAYGGDDYVRGTKGDDVVAGGDGDDTISAYGGDDIVVGGAGADLLVTQFKGKAVAAGDDVFLGGTGADTLEIHDDATATVVFRKGDGADMVEGFDGDDLVLAGYSAADLDTDGDGDFDAQDLAARMSSRETGRKEISTTLDLGGSDEIVFVHGPDGAGPAFGDLTLIPDAGAASGPVSTALELAAMDGSLGAPVAPPPPPTDETPIPVDPDPAPVVIMPPDPDPVDPAPVDPAPVDPAPVDPAPVDPVPVDPAPQPGIALITAPVTLADREVLVLDHEDAFATDEGSLSLTFRPEDADRTQTILSKDSRGYDEGGHLGVTIRNGEIEVRAQTATTSLTLKGGEVSADALNDLSLSWADGSLSVVLNGTAVGVIDGWTDGLARNVEPIVIGASQARSGDGVADGLREFFTGEITAATFGGPDAGDVDVVDEMDPPAPDPTPS